MKFSRKTRRITLTGLGAVAALVPLAATTAASAAPHHPAHHPRFAAAAVTLASPQYVQLLGIQGGGPYKGYVNYTDYATAQPGSHVLAPVTGQTAQLAVQALGNTYTHTMGPVALQAVNGHKVAFTGSGYWNANPADTWSVTGSVDGTKVAFTIKYDAWAQPAYSATDVGTINPATGAASGTFKDSAGVTGTWSEPANTYRGVDHYAAPLASAVIGHHKADLGYTIPKGAPSSPVPYAGHKIVFRLVDGGAGLASDKLAMSLDHGAFAPLALAGGNVLIP
jgi:hypothetical protein